MEYSSTFFYYRAKVPYIHDQQSNNTLFFVCIKLITAKNKTDFQQY